MNIVINVKQFGAAGNGRTDDTSAIQRALDQAAGKGVSVLFPKGTYLIDPGRTLIVGSKTRLFGQGSGNSILQASGVRFGWELMRVKGSDAEIDSLGFDGSNQVNRVLTVGGNTARVTLQNLTIANASQSKVPGEGYAEVVCGIVIYGSTRQIKIDQVEVKNIYAIHQSSGGSMVARGIYVTSAWGSAEKVAKQVTITRSYIHHVGPADDGDGIYYEDPGMDNNQGEIADSMISDNTLDHCAKRAVKIYAMGITISGNHIVNSYLNTNYYQGVNKGKLAPDMFSAISLYGSSNTVNGNLIDGVGSFYAAIEVSASRTLSNIMISSNRIVMGSRSTVKGTTSIRLGNIDGFSIEDNRMEQGERGIWTWQNANLGLMKNNTIIMPQGGGIDLSTYVSGCVQSNLVLEGNQITAALFKIKTAPTNRNVQIRD